MSCLSRQQWMGLVEHRFELGSDSVGQDEPGGWTEAVAHLEGCDSCREVAVELDPSLLFQRLAAPIPSLDETKEVASMQQAVAALRRADRIERPERARRDSWTLGGRWAAAAVVALTALSLSAGVWSDGVWSDGVWSDDETVASGPTPQPDGAESRLVGPSPDPTSPGPTPPSLSSVVLDAVDEIPAIEPLGTPDSARVEDSLIWEGEDGTVIWLAVSEVADTTGVLQGV